VNTFCEHKDWELWTHPIRSPAQQITLICIIHENIFLAHHYVQRWCSFDVVVSARDASLVMRYGFRNFTRHNSYQHHSNPPCAYRQSHRSIWQNLFCLCQWWCDIANGSLPTHASTLAATPTSKWLETVAREHSWIKRLRSLMSSHAEVLWTL